jgi:hypothetical protein
VATCPGQDQWLVVWRNATPKIYARFLTGAGLVDGAPLDVFNAYAGDQLAPAVACMPGGARYLIAWEQEYVGPLFGIWARSLGTAKAFLTPGFAVRPVFGSQTRHARSPALVGGAPGWSAVWVQEREGSTFSDLHGAPVWALFADDFESGDTGFWSSVAP